MAADIPFEQTHLESLSLPSLSLEVSAEHAFVERAARYTQRLPGIWDALLDVLRQEEVFQENGLDLSRQTLEAELGWIGNEAMHHLNRTYREKDSPTDVLTFTLFADAAGDGPWRSLPVIQLGSVFVSIAWAEDAVRETPDRLERYLLERFVHGMLHLLGCHHDTMPEYERVVAIQNRVLDSALGVQQP